MSFGLFPYHLNWILTDGYGYAFVIAGIFCGVGMTSNLLLIRFWFCGKSIRRWTAARQLGQVTLELS